MGFITEMATGVPGLHRPDSECRPHPWPRRCGSTATARRPSASGTRPRLGKRALPARSTAGRRGRASTSSMASSAARPTSGRRSSTTASRQVELPDDPELPLHDRHDGQGGRLDQVPEGADARQAVVRLLRARARRMRRTTCRRNGSRAGRASSIRAGTRCARNRWPGRSRWASCRAGTKLAPKPPAIKDWDTLSADEKRLFARQAEVFAAFVEYTDHEIGRMLAGLRGRRRRPTTRWSSTSPATTAPAAKAARTACSTSTPISTACRRTVPDMLKRIDQWGGPETYPHMAAGWAVAFNAPFGWMKQVPSDFGGTRNGMVVHWPKGIKAKNEYSHPVRPRHRRGADHPARRSACRNRRSVNGVPQIPMEGTSLLVHASTMPRRRSAVPRSTSRSPAIARSTTTAGTRAPSTGHRGNPSRAGRSRTIRPGSSTTCDPTSAWPTTLPPRTRRSSRRCRRCSCRKPRSTTCCRWTIACSSAWTRAAVGRPDLMGGRTSLTLAEGMTGMMESVFINVKNQLEDHHGRVRRARGWRQRHHPRAGRAVRRLVALRQGRRAGL